MATWKEHRALVEQYADAAASGLPRTAAAIRAVLARLDAAEMALEEQRYSRGDERLADDYDALCAEQDKS